MNLEAHRPLEDGEIVVPDYDYPDDVLIQSIRTSDSVVSRPIPSVIDYDSLEITDLPDIPPFDYD